MRRPLAECHLEDAICDRLRALRIKKHREHVLNGGGCYVDNPYTQGAVGRRLGVSNTTINRWEMGLGHHPRSLARFDRWARVLGSSFKDEFLAVVGETLAGAIDKSQGR